MKLQVPLVFLTLALILLAGCGQKAANMDDTVDVTAVELPTDDVSAVEADIAALPDLDAELNDASLDDLTSDLDELDALDLE